MTDPQLAERVETALVFAAQQVRRLVTPYADDFPLHPEGGRWRHGKAAWMNWCEGFLVRPGGQ